MKLSDLIRPFVSLTLVSMIVSCIDDLPARPCTSDGECLQSGVRGSCTRSPSSSASYCVFPSAECTAGRWGRLAGDDLASTCLDTSAGYDARVTESGRDAHEADGGLLDAWIGDAAAFDAPGQYDGRTDAAVEPPAVDAAPDAPSGGPLDTVITQQPPAVSGRNVEFHFTATRAGTFQCRLSPVEASYSTCTSPKTYANLRDTNNPHLFYVRAVDVANNTDDTPASYEWTVDSTGPTATILSPSTRSGPLPLISFTTEPNATYACRLDSGATFACISGMQAPAALADGTHVVFVTGTDALSNSGAEAMKSFTVDTTKPMFTTFSGPSPMVNGTTYRTVTFAYTVSDNSGLSPTVSCLLDGVAPPSGCLSPITLSGIPFGPHSFSATVSDDVGNSDTIAKSWAVSPVYTGQSAEAAVLGQPDSTSVEDPAAVDGKHFGPYGVAWDGTRLFVADYDHRRVLAWTGIPSASFALADYVIGQANATTVDTSAPSASRFDPNQADLFICARQGHLLVSDARASRALDFESTFIATDMSATLFFGQTSPTGTTSGSGPNQLSFPLGCSAYGGRAVIADSGNNRVLLWNAYPTTNGASANIALGPSNTSSKGSMDPPSPNTLKFVQGVAYDGQRVYVGDYGHNRVLIWNQWPTISGAAPNVVVGQPGFDSDSAGTGAGQLSSVGGIAASGGVLFVADGARVLVYSPVPTTSGAHAIAVLGQNDTNSNSRPTLPTASNINLALDVVVVNDLLVVADYGFRRVVFYKLKLD